MNNWWKPILFTVIVLAVSVLLLILFVMLVAALCPGLRC